MNLRDALDVKVGSTPVKKIYKGSYKVWDRNKIALEGYCIQNGTPSPDNEVPIEVMQGRQVVTVKGTDYTVDLKSENLLNQNIAPTTIYVTDTATRIGYEIPLPAGQYTISNGNVNIFTKSKYGNTYTTPVGTQAPVVLTLPEDGYILVYSGNRDILNAVRIMVNKGSIALPYEPYYDYKLAGIEDYKDNFYTDKGKWYFKQNVGKYLVNNDLESNEEQTNRISLLTPILNVIPNNSTAQYKSNLMLGNITNDTGMNGTTGSKKIRVVLSKEYASNHSEASTFLTNKKMQIYFPFEIPTVTEVPSTYTTLINQLNALYQAM